MGFSGTPKDMGPPYGKRDPYYSLIPLPFFESLKDMGIVWETYHKGVPCPWGSLESPLIGLAALLTVLYNYN